MSPPSSAGRKSDDSRLVLVGACDLLADRCVAAAARRELAGHLPCVPHLWRKKDVSITSTNACCWLVLVPVRRERFHRGAPGPAQLARRARARLRGRLCRLACTPTAACSTSGCGVLGLRIWPAGSARVERPTRDLPFGVRIVDAGVELPGRTAPADELCCCCWHGRVARARLLHYSSPALEPQHSPNPSPSRLIQAV